MNKISIEIMLIKIEDMFQVQRMVIIYMFDCISLETFRVTKEKETKKSQTGLNKINFEIMFTKIKDMFNCL